LLASINHLLVAGHETTLGLICSGTVAFIRNPEQWDLLQADPDELCVSATEECLRYEPTVKVVPLRVATRDVELRGQMIHAGDMVYWAISSANRDPRVFSDPETFDIRRSPNPHIGFGGGIHHCIGAALARVEGQEAFKALVRNFPRLRLLDDEVEYVPRLIERVVVSLPVAWD
jgi:cytochrome P450